MHPAVVTCSRTNPVTGVCEAYQDQYTCTVPNETVTQATNCPTNVFCLGTSCFNTAYTNDADFARTMSMLEAGREAVYLDSDRMQVFKGSQQLPRPPSHQLLQLRRIWPRHDEQSVFGAGRAWSTTF
jgi:hypothetical protein